MHDIATQHPSPDTEPDETADAPTGLSRRAFLGRAGAAGAGTAVLAATLAPAASAAPAAAPTAKVTPKAEVASTASRPLAAPGLPDAAAVQAQNKPLIDHEIFELAALLRAGATTSVELTQAYLDRVERFNGPFEVYGDNGGYNTFVRIARDEALSEARAADARIAVERAGGVAAPYLCGIPMGIKDSVGIGGRPSKNGTHAYDANIALEDSTAVSRLRDQGVVFLGHTVCSAYSGVIAGNFAGNAWNKDYIPGGSSQGSGGAAINRLAAAAIGEETGGSITWPSSINGSSAIKPSLGLGSMSGVMPLSPSYDVLGPLARSGRDAALIMNALIGPDTDNDPQSAAAPTPFPELPMVPRQGSKPLKGLTIGIPQTDWMISTTRSFKPDGSLLLTSTVLTGQSPQASYAPDHKAAFDRVRGELEDLGATVKEFRGLDITNYGTEASKYTDGENPYFNNPYVLATIDGTKVMPAAAATNGNREEIRYIQAVKAYAATQSTAVQTELAGAYGRKPGGSTDPAVAPTLDAGIALTAGITSDIRNDAEARRRQLVTNYQKALDDEGVDMMLVMSIGAEVGKRNPLNASDGLPLRRNNQIANAISWPLVNFPVGVTSNAGLPICVQLWGPRFSEPRLVQAMIDYQAHHPEHHTRFPADPANVAPRTLSPKLAAQAARGEGDIDQLAHNDPLVAEQAAIAP